MRINIYNQMYSEASFNVDNVNYVLSPNGGGKTTFCAILKDGFDGKLNRNFVVNGEVVAKNLYSVYSVDATDTIDVEKGLTSKTIMKGKITKCLLDLDDNVKNELNTKINTVKEEIESILDKEIEDIQLRLELNMADLINKFSELSYHGKNINEMSFSQKRFAYFHFICNEIMNDPKACILIIDEVNMGLSSGMLRRVIELLQELSKNKKVTIFMTSSSCDDMQLNKIFIKQYAITNDIIDIEKVMSDISLDETCSIEDVKEYYSEEEIKRYVKKNNILEKIMSEFLNS